MSTSDNKSKVVSEIEKIVDSVQNQGILRYKWKTNATNALLTLLESSIEQQCLEVIGEDVPIFVGGKQVKKGDAMMIDLSAGVESSVFRESCKNIQENGRNLEKADMRKRLTELKEGKSNE